MPSSTLYFRYGGRKGRRQRLKISADLMVVRTQSHRELVNQAFDSAVQNVLSSFERVLHIPEAGVSVLRAKAARGVRALRDNGRMLLRDQEGVRFAGRGLVSPQGEPVLYTENLFVQLDEEMSEAACRRWIKAQQLEIKRPLAYARNAWFVGLPEGSGQEVFSRSMELQDDAKVNLCHPELVREVARKAAFPEQWHLQRTQVNGVDIDQHANVVAAWELSEGTGVTIAIINDGVDLGHQEFQGAGKIVAPRDVTGADDDPSPGANDRHGTACAGVAAANGLHGASGVAPKARLMPIRLVSHLGSQAEADAFQWAADHGADVISCSWGPVDGNWTQPDDPVHEDQVALPDSTRLAIDYAITQGRGGRGCVITWAAGNGNESVDNDGYASYNKVIAVAACNDTGTRAAYSDRGAALWCAFPSSNGYASQTRGIWTTDVSGRAGYNAGNSFDGDSEGHYTNSFGGTSSACPGAAGVAALVIARNPELRWDQVRQVLKDCCDPIDQAGGSYDANGHSTDYGYGRLNARRAVELATPAAAPAPGAGYTVIHRPCAR